ncbi:MAG: protein kinase, partial [Chlamydiales bacterium]
MQNHSDQTHTIRCLACHRLYQLQSADTPRFCPLCGHAQSAPLTPASGQELATSYQIMETIGKGGMGEVFAAFDPQCKRRIALKRIRLDLLEHPQIRHRFLKEAHITCQLTHPAIIPIYAIQSSPESVFYTMPLVEGETLKQILRKTRRQEKKGEKLDHIGGSIPALMRIFVTVCQAVAYAHSKGILHRDLKPENVIVGKYGEVLILDWGLAKWIDQKCEDEFEIGLPNEPAKSHFQTRMGKVVGTIAYMAPERATGEPANIQTDIYALGVMLYQMLALRNPFQRGSLEEFRKKAHLEELIDPIIAAPHRDVPKMLAQYTLKCLAKDPKERYHTVDELIHDLETYVEGRSEWFHMADLNINEKADWEFQENVLLAEHIAITRTTEEAEWVS